MTASPQTVSDFVKLAREAVLAKDFDLAETYKKQALEIKGLDDITPKVDVTKRLDMSSADDPAAHSGTVSRPQQADKEHRKQADVGHYITLE